MKKFRTLVFNAEVGPVGVLTLALIFLAIHALAFTFKEYGLLPLFYLIVFFAIVTNMILDWLKEKYN